MIPFAGVVSGAIVLGYYVAGLFFIRFWRETHDRLFLIFGVAFWILGLQRFMLVLPQFAEQSTLLYGVRLGAFLLILAAIIDKNRDKSHGVEG
jgi:hypothetical protein